MAQLARTPAVPAKKSQPARGGGAEGPPARLAWGGRGGVPPPLFFGGIFLGGVYLGATRPDGYIASGVMWIAGLF